MNGRLVAVDVETTGLIPGFDRIVEIGAVAFTVDGAIEGEFSELVDPGVPIPQAASRVSGITDETVRGAPTVGEVLPRFLCFLDQAAPVAHNAPFDAGFLAADIASLGLRGPAAPFIDTRGLARMVFPGRTSYGLESLSRELGIRERSAHRGLADAHACRRLFLACLRKSNELSEAAPETLAARSGPAIDLADRAPRVVARIVTLRRALEAGRDVDIVYESAGGEQTRRRITPRSFLIRGGAPALVAFCQLRGRERTFIVESIREIMPA